MARPSCIRCTIKHITKAIALLVESRLGYPLHRFLAVGELAEAEAEALRWYGLAVSIREERVRILDDPTYEPDLMPLLEQAAFAYNAEQQSLDRPILVIPIPENQPPDEPLFQEL